MIRFSNIEWWWNWQITGKQIIIIKNSLSKPFLIWNSNKFHSLTIFQLYQQQQNPLQYFFSIRNLNQTLLYKSCQWLIIPIIHTLRWIEKNKKLNFEIILTCTLHFFQCVCCYCFPISSNTMYIQFIYDIGLLSNFFSKYVKICCCCYDVTKKRILRIGINMKLLLHK